jgi:hypothetical protein
MGVRAKRASAVALACGLAMIAGAASAGSGVMGGGLQQLVNSWELGDARLSSHLDLHLKDAQGNPLVRVKLEDGAALSQVLSKLQATGFKLKAISVMDPSIMEGYMPLAAARSAARIDGVRAMRAVQRPVRNVGAVQSQAVKMLKADLAQSHGYDGTGIRIGALSDSFNACGAACSTTAQDDIATGDLPAAGVTVLQDMPPATGSDEGRAMLQLVHDVAPGAQLAFATAFESEVGFANNILALQSVFKADVIVDDVIYFDEPMFSDGILAQAVDAVSKKGTAYFSSAGNNGTEAYEATYQPVSFADATAMGAAGKHNLKLDQIPAAVRPKSLHLFDDSGQDRSIVQHFTSGALNYISFQWDEPFYMGRVKTDYNVYVFDKNGNWMDPSSAAFPGFYSLDDNTQTDEAFEIVILPPFPTDVQGGANASDYQIVIGKMNDGPARHIKYVNINGLGISERQGAGSIFGHAAARGGQAVAAAYYAIPKFPEDFSAGGPVAIYFDAKGNRRSEPEIRLVPQITAADGNDTTFFGFDADANGLPNFFGTSASAPNAAAVAALALQAAGGTGSLPPASLYRIMQFTATPMWLTNDRTWSAADAGPVKFAAQGDWVRWKDYFSLTYVGRSRNAAVKSVSFDTADTGLAWSANPARFHVGDASGVAITDITRSLSADQKIFTLNFAPGSFKAGESFHFGMSLFNPLQGTTQEDPDRLRGVKLTVTLESGETYNASIYASLPLPINRYTGMGLVNADAATRAAALRQRFDD